MRKAMTKASMTPPADMPNRAAVAISRSNPSTRLASVPRPVTDAGDQSIYTLPGMHRSPC